MRLDRGAWWISGWLAGAWLFAASAAAQLPPECGDLGNGYGPYDYTNAEHFNNKLGIVEGAHFNQRVRSLQGGQSGATAGGDLDYTLRAFPNHHQALYAMARYGLQHQGQAKPPGSRYTVDCWFRRAEAFQPRDGTVRMIHGIYAYKLKRHNEALEKFKEALALMPNSAETHYNIGLLYVELKEYELAREHAVKSYKLGYPLLGLKNKLARAGQWRDGDS